MRKLITLLMAAILAVSLCACGIPRTQSAKEKTIPNIDLPEHSQTVKEVIYINDNVKLQDIDNLMAQLLYAYKNAEKKDFCLKAGELFSEYHELFDEYGDALERLYPASTFFTLRYRIASYVTSHDLFLDDAEEIESTYNEAVDYCNSLSDIFYDQELFS